TAGSNSCKVTACTFTPLFQGRASPDLLISLTLAYYSFHIAVADILLDRSAFGTTYTMARCRNLLQFPRPSKFGSSTVFPISAAVGEIPFRRAIARLRQSNFAGARQCLY